MFSVRLVPVVVRVVVSGGQSRRSCAEVLEEPLLELVHPHTARRVRGVDAGDPMRDAALADGLVDIVGDVPNLESPRGPKPGFPLEDLHRARS
jgi:hypothetical protein